MIEVHEAVVTAWDNAGLEAIFKAYWDNANASDFYALLDQVGEEGNPMPFCLFEQESDPEILYRMTSTQTFQKREVRDYPFRFTIVSRASASQDAKEIAGELVDQIKKVFGGHHEERPTGDLALTNGNFLQSQYQGELGANIGDEEYRLAVRYLFKVDVPVMV